MTTQEKENYQDLILDGARTQGTVIMEWDKVNEMFPEPTLVPKSRNATSAGEILFGRKLDSVKSQVDQINDFCRLNGLDWYKDHVRDSIIFRRKKS